MSERNGYRELRVNEPPPGWTLEDDVREEMLALSELVADARSRRQRPEPGGYA